MDALTSNSPSKKAPSLARLRAQATECPALDRFAHARRVEPLGARSSGRQSVGLACLVASGCGTAGLSACLARSAGPVMVHQSRERPMQRRQAARKDRGAHQQLCGANKMAEKSKGPSVQANPSLYLSPEIGVNPVFTPPSPEIFGERTQSLKQKGGKELGSGMVRFRVTFWGLDFVVKRPLLVHISAYRIERNRWRCRADAGSRKANPPQANFDVWTTARLRRNCLRDTGGAGRQKERSR